jgi:hypothetical protein
MRPFSAASHCMESHKSEVCLACFCCIGRSIISRRVACPEYAQLALDPRIDKPTLRIHSEIY